jgi:hypothetical protein
VQSQKQEVAMVSIDEGMQIACNDAQSQNAKLPRTEIVESRSNVKCESPAHLLKHDLSILFIDEGM